MNLLSYCTVSELLKYDKDTGLLFWKARNVSWFSDAELPQRSCNTFNTRFAGTLAGHVRKDKYIHVILLGNSYKAHRLAWLLHHKQWPTNQIDHVDGNPSNNKIDNLREATPAQNMANKRCYRNNTTGQKGVHNPEPGKWTARIQHNNKRIVLGTFNTFEDARDAYISASSIYHGDFRHE